MKTYLKIILSIFLFSLLVPFFAKAITFNPPFETKSFEELIDAIINFIFWVAMAIVPIMIIVAAFYFLTSGGNPEKVSTAKKIILFTFIGLFIVLLAKGISSIIEQILKGPPVCVLDGGNGNCPAGCLGNPADPDCVCQNDNGWCGIGCNSANDNDCPGITPALLSQMGDLNGDCVINYADLFFVAKAFGSKPGDPNWNPNVDFKQDNVIDNYDVEIFKFSYGLGVECGDLITPVLLFKMGDLNSDCKIDGADLFFVAHAFGSKPGDPNWNPNVDFKQDNVIDNYDVEIFKFNYGLDVKCS